MNFLFALILNAHAFTMGTPVELTSIDPFRLGGIDAYTVTGFVIEPMAKVDPLTKRIEPLLAEIWKIDGRTLRVVLRPKKFHDGSALDASDVKWTFDAYLDPKNKGEFWRGMWSEVESATVIDDRTIEFKFKTLNYETFKSLMTALRILPAGEKKLVGTGPFKLKSFKPGRLELEPSLTVKYVRDARLAKEMIAKKQLDFYPAGPEIAGAQGFESATGEGLWIDLNLKNRYFKKIENRHAVARAWNRERLNEKVYGGRWELAIDAFSPRMSFYPPTNSFVWGATPPPEKFSFTLLVKNDRQNRWASLLQQDLKKVGIEMKIEMVGEDAQWWQKLKDGKFDAVAGGGPVSDEVYEVSWHSKGAYNFYGFADKTVDRELEKLRGEFDSKKRDFIQRELIAKIRDSYAQIPGLYLRRQYFLLSPRLEVDPRTPADPAKWRLKN